MSICYLIALSVVSLPSKNANNVVFKWSFKNLVTPYAIAKDFSLVIALIVSPSFSLALGSVTVTTQKAERFDPSLVVAVIVVVPAEIPVTFPLVSTVATFSSLEDHVTVLSDTFSGKIVAVKVVVAPLSRSHDLKSNDIDDAVIGVELAGTVDTGSFHQRHLEVGLQILLEEEDGRRTCNGRNDQR